MLCNDEQITLYLVKRGLFILKGDIMFMLHLKLVALPSSGQKIRKCGFKESTISCL